MAETTVKLDSRNANRGTERGEYMVEHSLRTYGAGRSVVLDKNDVVIAGNKTVSKAIELGIPIQVIESDGTTLYAIKRTDLDLTSDTAAMELGIVDNRSSEVGLEWDADVLTALQEDGADLSAFWYDDELLAVLEPETTITEGLTDPDAVPEPPKEATTKPGDLWVMGRHRLLCGDSTVATDVERLLDGNVPALIVTDPPYGVEYDANWRNDAAEKGLISHADRRVGKVSNDDRIDWREAWSLVSADVMYCWHADRHASAVQASIEDVGYEVRCQIIWAKTNFAISRGHYHWKHEPCWYAVRKGATASWIGDHSQTTLWEITWDKNVEGGHSTQKPVECMARPLRNHEGDAYDPFLGSGTTLIAAEQLGRTCYGMEIDPIYCDVIVTRWQNFTGQTATLMDGQNSHGRS
jgi:DNA modification methylase